MGKRGIKICLKCSKPNGARSLQCASCGCGFIIKGVKHPDLDLVGISAATNVTAKAGNKKEASSTLLSSFDIYEPTRYLIECTDAQETETRTKNYGPNSKTWNSICGHFRVRYTPEFLGTSIEDSQKYTLFVKIGDLWRFPKVRTKFCSLKQLVKYMLKLNPDGTEKHKCKVGT